MAVPNRRQPGVSTPNFNKQTSELDYYNSCFWTVGWEGTHSLTTHYSIMKNKMYHHLLIVTSMKNHQPVTLQSQEHVFTSVLAILKLRGGIGFIL